MADNIYVTDENVRFIRDTEEKITKHIESVSDTDGGVYVSTDSGKMWVGKKRVGANLAEEVYFAENFSITEKFGNYGPQSGHKLTECNVKGKSIAEFIKDAFTTTTTPTVTSNPSISLTVSPSKVWRGSTDDITYRITFIEGTYSDDTASNISPSGSVKPTFSVRFNNQTKDTQTGTFNNVYINANKSMSATASWNKDTVQLKDNQGNNVDTKIAAGSDTKSATISTYLGCFYTLSDSKITTFTPDNIRSWAHTVADKFSDKLTIRESWTNLYIAIPETSNITKFNPQEDIGMQLPFASSIHSSEIDVGDAAKISAMYSIFKIENNSPYEATTIRFNWS